MSVITNWPAMPNRLFILFRYLLEKGERGEDKQRLAAIFTPVSLLRKRGEGGDDEGTSGKTILDDVLREAKIIGLVEEQEERISLLETYSKREVNRMGIEEFFIRIAERILLDPETAELKGQKDIAPALSWLLMQDPANPLMFSENHRGRVINDLGEDTGAYGLNVNSDFQNLVYWARFLGYCHWIAVDQTTYIVPDPTHAIMRRLPEIFTDSKEVRFMDFIAALAVSCPVLEQGYTRREVESIARPELITEPRTLSRSTSLALRRLENQGTIKMELLSDADVVTVFTDGDAKRHSHIQYRG